jgi:hypothetical protein
VRIRSVGWVERTRETHRTLARQTVGLTSTFDPPYTSIYCSSLLICSMTQRSMSRSISG